MNHIEWPELWALWFVGPERWVESFGEVGTRPEVYINQKDAELAAEYYERFYGMQCEPRRISVPPPPLEDKSDPPNTIYLQWHGAPELTWATEPVFSDDVRYVKDQH